MRRAPRTRDSTAPRPEGRRRPSSLVLIEAHSALRAEATTWRLSPTGSAQGRADELDRLADELRGLLRRWH